MNPSLVGFPVVVRLPVAWGEMDALQHVNNAVYFRYFESSRVEYLERAGLSELMRSGVGPVLAEIRCRFRIPLAYPDTALVGTKLERIDADRVLVKHVVVSEKHGRVAAEGDATLAFIDVAAQRKAPIPASFLERLAALEAQGDTGGGASG